MRGRDRKKKPALRGQMILVTLGVLYFLGRKATKKSLPVVPVKRLAVKCQGTENAYYSDLPDFLSNLLKRDYI